MNFGDRYRKSKILIALSLLLIFYGCEKLDIHSKGLDIEREFLFEKFEEVFVNDIFDIVLANDSIYSVRIYSHEGLIDNIGCSTEDSKLHLTDKNSYQWLPDYPRARVVISFPDIKRITTFAPCNISSEDTLIVNDLRIETNELITEVDLTLKAGSLSLVTHTEDFGVYMLRGTANTARFAVSGGAKLFAGELKTGYTNILSRTVEDSYVWAEKRLVAGLRHYGNIYYHGDPEEIVIEEKSSRGRLFPAD